jgi:hypothetical protein
MVIVRSCSSSFGRDRVKLARPRRPSRSAAMIVTRELLRRSSRRAGGWTGPAQRRAG